MRRVRLKIKEVAAEKHMSMRQLHLRSEIALSRMKKFYRNPDIDIKLGTLARIAEVLDVPICDLFEEYEE
jgi:DNA-binding Xre family transcriptional regulator